MDTDRWHFWGHTDHQCPDDHCHMTEPTSLALSVIGDTLCPHDTAH
ncbi:unnamed protein product, partial [Staurois parvus]